MPAQVTQYFHLFVRFLIKQQYYSLPVVPLFPNIITKDAGNKIAALRLSVWQWIDNCSYHSLVLTLPLIHDYVKPIIYPSIIKFLFTLLLHSDTIL